MSSPILNCRPSLEGKVAFVTGGMGGIGQATVIALAAHGVRVAFTFAEGHEDPSVAELFAESLPDQLSAHSIDLRSNSSIVASLSEANERWGHVDILVNAAAVGTATVATYAEDPAEQDSAMLSINADGNLKLCQAYLGLIGPHRNDRVRKIINFSSVGGGVQVFPGFRLSDGMSKAAVAFLTRQLAAELVDTSVDVFAICPGATNTRMFQASTLDAMSPEERSAFSSSLPKGRLIEPEEIADLVVFLASGYSTPLHGSVLDASMGLGVRPGIITEQTH